MPNAAPTQSVVNKPEDLGELPTSAGKDVTVRACGACHAVSMWSHSRQSRMAWDETMRRMTVKGLALGASDYEAVLQYLSVYFGVVNVNTAPLAELMRALRITQQQANAIITYRETNGPFRDIGALKRVEGLDAAAIESNRSAITF